MSEQTYNLNEILSKTNWVQRRAQLVAQIEGTLESPFPDDRRSDEALALLRSKRQAFTMREIKILIGNMMLRDACHALTWVSDKMHHGVPYRSDDDSWERWLSHDGWDQAPE